MDLKNLMILFSEYIIFDETLREQVNKEIKERQQITMENSQIIDVDFLTNNVDIFDKNSIGLVINNEKDKLGQIKWVSQNVMDMIGYSKEEMEM